MIPDYLTKETIYGEVVSKANHYFAVPDKQGKRRIIKDDLIREYEINFNNQISLYRNRQISARFVFYVEIYYLNIQHDLDNSLKTILDCLQYANAIIDDKLCIEIHASKHRAKDRAKVVFAIKELEPNLI